MILKVFCLYDLKVGVFNTPFFMAHVGQAVRACMDLGRDRETMVGRHPADFALLEIGEYDDQNGMLVAINHRNLGSVVSMMGSEQGEFDLKAAQ
ncbi:nonstructural protein [Blackfly microvirus SF02]|uniref:Nonstructural protein n=1 Tax=Blackfly microvirus SF02 TaxID=2576452 RepID=A0A4P8PKE6_9VIRU|nr:nonstructural protein [Blackfly microvirus SF02]